MRGLEPEPHPEPHPEPESGGGKARQWGLALALLVIAAALLLAVGLRGSGGSPQLAPPLSLGPTTSISPDVVEPESALAAPISLRIPQIGVDETLIELGLNADETVEVPLDYQKPGWFKYGPTPGTTGSSVILGHVDSFDGPAVFYQLDSLAAGDRVEVTLADGATAHFEVTRLATYPKEQFPAEEVYGEHGYSALQLVTCGGEFDPVTRSYESNVVAYTSLVETVSASGEVIPAPASARAPMDSSP
ncbi:class F sortase [Rhodococcus sp. IEGM 1379]|uniref:class F sortase n=1 Tax=Rhodococcus sp. IEGM 1379 TaxID=3047086 RepID=UPI0024B6F994|nr:class F sortase [Rhodococcus sp. IEGM 1379]MDI9918638.1 class F sortase [Rhodococcus sp. IEGM 1379]